MAYYGIPSASKAITASTANDTVSMANLGGTLVTAASVYGGDGNDIISFAAVGITASARNVVSGVSGLTSGFMRIYMVQPHIPAQKNLRNRVTATVQLGVFSLRSKLLAASSILTFKVILATTPLLLAMQSQLFPLQPLQVELVTTSLAASKT